MNRLYYKLNGHEPVATHDVLDWATWFERVQATGERIVASDMINGVHVSTVFLGLDHGYNTVAEPILFETMIFGGEHDMWQNRYSTWEEAEAGHKEAVKLVQQ